MRRVSRAPRAKALAVALVVAVAGFTLAACGNPETEVEGCTGTSSEVVAAISTKLNNNVGRLRNTHQFAKGTGGITFITAELHDPEKGDISRGKTKAQIECEQDQLDANAPALPGNKDCEDL